MISKQAKVTSKGQVTIPLEVRRALKLREGDTVTFEVDDKGRANLHPEHEIDPFDKWAGALAEGKGLSKKQIVKQIREERGW